MVRGEPQTFATDWWGVGVMLFELADGGVIDARLVVGADGRASALRRAARINVTEWSYDQAALVVTVAHARPHQGVAEE